MGLKKNRKQLFTAVAFLFVLSLGAKVEIPLATINITLQTLILLVAYSFLTLPFRLGLVISYIVLGGLGLPVFNDGLGFSYVFSTPIGFFLGFVAVAFLPIKQGSLLQIINYFLIAHLIILVLGITGLFLYGIEPYKVVEIITPLIIGALVKSGLGGLFVAGMNKLNFNR